jgi:hypothetical protein
VANAPLPKLLSDCASFRLTGRLMLLLLQGIW